MSTKIDLLKDGINNSLMLINEEYKKLGYTEVEAKLYTSKIVSNYLQNFGTNDILKEGITKIYKQLGIEYSKETDENRKRELYLKIETMTHALDIIEEVMN